MRRGTVIGLGLVVVAIAAAVVFVVLGRSDGGVSNSMPRAALPTDDYEPSSIRNQESDAGTQRHDDGAGAEAGEFLTEPMPSTVEDPDPTDRAFVEEFGEPSPELVRSAFESALADAFPDYRLSSDEIERASSALFRLRETRMALDALAMDPATARERRRLLATLEEAVEEFTDVMDMDPAAFTAAADRQAGQSGIDRDVGPKSGDAYVPDDDYLETRR